MFGYLPTVAIGIFIIAILVIANLIVYVRDQREKGQ